MSGFFRGAKHFQFVFKEEGAQHFGGGMQQHARMPGNSSTEPFPLPMNPERNFGLLCAKAAIERVGEWGWSRNNSLCCVQGHKKYFSKEDCY